MFQPLCTDSALCGAHSSSKILACWRLKAVQAADTARPMPDTAVQAQHQEVAPSFLFFFPVHVIASDALAVRNSPASFSELKTRLADSITSAGIPRAIGCGLGLYVVYIYIGVIW